MKNNISYVGLILLFGLLACNNNDDNNNPEPEIDSQLKFATTPPTAANVNAVDFTLTNVGVYDNYLFSNIEYVGGNKSHEFSVTWNGEVGTEEENKMIRLDIYHLTSDDDGTRNVEDSLYISLDDLNIPEDLLTDENLYFDVVNTTNTDNHFVVKGYEEEVVVPFEEPQTYIHYYNYELKVVDAECSEIGKWNNKWLKSASSDSIQYFIPVEIDEEITYEAKVDDLVKVKLQYLSIDDIGGGHTCDFITDENVIAIKIKEIEQIKE
ncbi:MULTISPECIES: hypothetical protein [unclassified Saccharicrinis]|uniref:hypothetical protein n=1 Tax=unclassified Saccharicrinis TaxID=2646859 RepID=UPI003D35459C